MFDRRDHWRRGIAIGLLLLVILTACSQTPATSTVAPTPASIPTPPAIATPTARPTTPTPLATPTSRVNVPLALPKRLGIGLVANPDQTGLDGWFPDSGVPWDYAYHYLTGGIGTGKGWDGWVPEGRWPLDYATKAATQHSIPVFSYYQLIQSPGKCAGCGEAPQDLSNLNNPTLMAAYYADFALLMKRLGNGTHDGIKGFGGTTIVHIEPDLSGYAEQAVLGTISCQGYCTGKGNDPALLNAAVASTGVRELSAYPNTYQGFNWALLHLRDLYAPNVLLANHVSTWASGPDVGNDTRLNLDVAALGSVAGQFAARSGMVMVPADTKAYDLLFNDVSDRDAGYYKYVVKRPNAYWDSLNATVPSFQRWIDYLQAVIVAAGGKPTFVWQIPLGNQYFATMDNTVGHYQDNRAEYFFAHPDEIADIGVIGLLFGAGSSDGVMYYDARNDGITNPPAFCTIDGRSTRQVCNDHQSVVADDDGGYIRQAGREYYQRLGLRR